MKDNITNVETANLLCFFVVVLGVLAPGVGDPKTAWEFIQPERFNPV